MISVTPTLLKILFPSSEMNEIVIFFLFVIIGLQYVLFYLLADKYDNEKIGRVEADSDKKFADFFIENDLAFLYNKLFSSFLVLSSLFLVKPQEKDFPNIIISYRLLYFIIFIVSHLFFMYYFKKIASKEYQTSDRDYYTISLAINHYLFFYFGYTFYLASLIFNFDKYSLALRLFELSGTFLSICMIPLICMLIVYLKRNSDYLKIKLKKIIIKSLLSKMLVFGAINKKSKTRRIGKSNWG